MCEMARGMARTPAPMTAGSSLGECFLTGKGGRGEQTGVHEVDDAAEPACLADHADFFAAGGIVP